MIYVFLLIVKQAYKSSHHKYSLIWINCYNSLASKYLHLPSDNCEYSRSWMWRKTKKSSPSKVELSLRKEIKNLRLTTAELSLWRKLRILGHRKWRNREAKVRAVILERDRELKATESQTVTCGGHIFVSPRRLKQEFDWLISYL